VSTGGGSGEIVYPFLSAYVAVSPNIFDVPTNLSISLASNSNASLFMDAATIYNSVKAFSLTGSTNYGFEDTVVQNISGGTRFPGINNLNALPLLSGSVRYLPHLPFVFSNKAANTLAFRKHISSTSTISGARGEAVITVKVPAFEYTVNGTKYKLKSFIVSRDEYLKLPQWYNQAGTVCTGYLYCDKFLTLSNHLLSTQNIALNPALSSSLGSTKMRAKLKADGSWPGYFGITSSDNWVSFVSGGGYFQKPFFLANAMRIDNEWGWPIDSRDEISDSIAKYFNAGGLLNSTLDTKTKNIVQYVIGGVNQYFFNNTQTFGIPISTLKFNYKALGIASASTISNTATASNGANKYYSIGVPFDTVANKLIISYYAK
jgi:hypothetical protein